MNKLAAVSILSAILGLFGCAKRDAGREEWSLATGTDNGFPLIVRFRNIVPEGVRPENYPDLVTVSWKFNPRANGMPESEDNARMEELEDLLDKSLESRKQGFMMMAVTCNGRREWQWYSRDQNEFKELLDVAVAGKPPFPVQISHTQDKEWSAYRAIQKRAKQ
jgi:hypothetical protein